MLRETAMQLSCIAFSFVIYFIKGEKGAPMDMSTLIPLLFNMGFPAVACYFMFQFMKDTMKENTKALDNLSDTIVELKATMQHITTYIIERQEEK